MRRLRVLLPLLAFVLLGAAALPPGVTMAQEATPAPRLGAPLPDECTVASRPVSYFASFVGTPTAEQAAALMAEATPPPDFTMPAGKPADEEKVDAVLEIVWQLGACINAGDFFGRYAALFTDDYLQRQFAEYGPLPEADLAMLEAAPTALAEEERVRLLAVEEVRELPDGRLAGLFHVYDPFAQQPGPSRIYWEFVTEDGRWLIDEEIMLGPIAPEPAGTPAP